MARPPRSEKRRRPTSAAPQKAASEPPKPAVRTVSLAAAPEWYAQLPPLPPPAPGTRTAVSSPDALTALLQRASVLHADVAAAASSSSSSSTATASRADDALLARILQTGTLADRLSALTLVVQSSPLHNTGALGTLRALAARAQGTGGRAEPLKALRCIVDWWVGGGAPDRKLRYFRDQPLAHPALDDRHLVVWYFEDWLKKYFFSVLQILETLSADPLPYIRTQALTFIFTLLKEKPEQEHNLLRLLVNKLGDSEKSICSRASYYILQLFQVHPSMKTVVILEITALVLRPTPATAMQAHTSSHERASKQGHPPKLAQKKHTNEHARYYATITLNQITFRSNEKEVAVQAIDLYFRLFADVLGEGRSVDDSEPSKRQAKEVVGDAGFTEVEDAHSKLVSAILTGVNRALPFAKLGAADTSLNKHIDTLFLITHKLTFNISLQALVLIQQICATLASQSKASPSTSISDRYYRTLYASLHDERLASSSKQTMYLNLLFKSLKADSNPERVRAFVRRFVQVLVSGGGAGGNEFVVGGLYLLGEISSTFPGLRNMFQGGSRQGAEEYDPRKRDPQYAHASVSPTYELLPLLRHYHPTVSLHAQQLLAAQPVSSSADLTLNTLSHFLDRFVYKNPKKPRPRGASAMQPDATGGGGGGGGVTRTRGEVARGVLPNEERFWRSRVEDVPVDEVFFHKFFSQKRRTRAAADGQAGSLAAASGEGGDDEDEDSELDEDAVWKAMQKSVRGRRDDDDLSPASDSDAEGDEDEDEDMGVGAGADEDESGVDGGDGEDDEDDDDDDDDDENGDNDDDAFSLAEDSDDEDLLAIDEMPGLVEYDGSHAECSNDGDDGDDESGGPGGGEERKRKRGDPARAGDAGGSGKGRKKRRTLPTFASYDDYAQMIEDGDQSPNTYPK